MERRPPTDREEHAVDRMIFVSLPVRDLAVARRFWTGLGFGVNECVSDEGVLCVVVSSAIVVLLVPRAQFADIAGGPVADAGTAEVVTGLSASTRREVDDLVARAVACGGVALRTVEDGPMYGRSFTDPDGHVWEVLHIETAVA